jgi:hypothetical protein
MLTIFSIPKPFRDHIGIIQRNALRSWTMLQPACEIILCGDDQSIQETSMEFGVKHLPDIAQNEFGTPLLNSAFEKVVKIAQFPILCYVNADIILLDDLMEAIKRIPFRQFLAVGQRTKVTISKVLDFEKTNWRSQLVEFTTKNGKLADVNGIDYFIFTPNGHLEKLPPFAVGRPSWDNWFIYHARDLHIPVIDVTRVCRVIHQNHDYSHVPEGKNNTYIGPEAIHNHELFVESIGSEHSCNINDATHILTGDFLLPSLGGRYLRQRLYTGVVLYPALKQIVDGLRRFFRLCRRIIERLGKLFLRRSLQNQK